MPRTLLIVSHCPSPNTRQLRDAAVAGARQSAIEGIEVVVRQPLQVKVNEVLAADAILIGTTENFGYMAGLTKDFFERIYYACLEKKQGLPVAVYIRAGNDGEGTRASLDRILTGLRWKTIREPLICRGEWCEEFNGQVEELAMTLAAGLEAGIY